VSDGIFHAAGFTATVVGLFLLADAARHLNSQALVGLAA
jgi:uncharacterized membrane protein